MVLAAVGQICSTASLAHNLSQCQTLVRKAVAAGAKALFLPEASDYIASSASESISLCLPIAKSHFVQGLQSAARTNSLPISVGIHEPSTTETPIAPHQKRIRNTLLWIDDDGSINNNKRYQKVHLFDVDLRPNGPVLKESDSIEPGDAIIPPFESPVGKIGAMICFDLRFPEISLSLRRQGAQILLYPSAFTVPTGKAHWETLLRARAVESQCWVIAAAQCGRHNGKRVSYGDTMVIGPWGEVEGRLEKVESIDDESGGVREPQLLVVDVDVGQAEKVRREMPLLRRTDIYPEV